MSQDRLYTLFEKQRKRQIAALLAVCGPEERERINIARQDYGLKGQYTIAQPSGLGGSSHPPQSSPCKGRISTDDYTALSERVNVDNIHNTQGAALG